MLSLENIQVTIAKGTKLERNVLSQLNLNVKSGELVAVIGGNGAGKSTVLNVISGILNPDVGAVWLDKKDITKVTGRKRSALIAKVLQDPKVGTIDQMTILENMAFASLRGRRRSFVPFARAKHKLKIQERLSCLGMGLEQRMHELVANLSGGQRQALSLAMALSSDSKILLLDEITAALDPNTAKKIMQIAVAVVRDQNRTTIMITHNMEHAIRHADRILVLSDGRFMREYSKSEIVGLSASDLADAMYRFN